MLASQFGRDRMVPLAMGGAGVAYHPWINGQVERMNRTIKEATVKRFHYDTHSQLETHITDFIAAYNYARRLKTLNGLTPFEYICKIWTSEPDRFILNPTHHTMGLTTVSWTFLLGTQPFVAACLIPFGARSLISLVRAASRLYVQYLPPSSERRETFEGSGCGCRRRSAVHAVRPLHRRPVNDQAG